jgi:acyl carrier protein
VNITIRLKTKEKETMERKELEGILTDGVIRVAKVDAGVISAASDLKDDLGMKSMNLFMLSTLLEAQVGFKIPIGDMLKAKTFGDAVDLLVQLQGNQSN